MKPYVITLKRTPHRLANFQKINAGSDRVEIYYATDESDLSFADLEARGLIAPGLKNYSIGGCGASVSHRTLWERAILLDQPVTVLEDDVILHDRFFEQAEQLMATLEPGWDYITWMWHFDSCLSFTMPGNISPCHAWFDQNELRRNTEAFQRQPVQPQLFKLHTAFGGTAYTMSPAGAKKMIDTCFPLTDKQIWFPALNKYVGNYGLDIVMNEMHRQENARSYVCFPPLAVSKNEHETSTVRGSERKDG